MGPVLADVASVIMFSFSGLVVAFFAVLSLFAFMDDGWRRDYRKNPRRALAQWAGATAACGILAFALVAWVIPWAALPHVSCAQAVAVEVQAAKDFDPYGLDYNDDSGSGGPEAYNRSLDTVGKVCDQPWEQRLVEDRMLVWCDTPPGTIPDVNLVPYGKCYGPE